MTVSYKKLWKLLIDRNMTKSELRKKTGIAGSTFSRMNKEEFVSLEVLAKICLELNCGLDDILEISK
ncbi:MAG: helix-turn-helix transcriptional regulator [Eubacteriales bacterium]|nr:helix-turn-helix transcriptional regulator [Eubacteriales bacterium]